MDLTSMELTARDRTKSRHQQDVERLMAGAGQYVPPVPTIPTVGVRVARARLLLEELAELIEDGLGLRLEKGPGFHVDLRSLDPVPCREPDLVEIADGCGDLTVVTTGTFSACGIAAEPILIEIDANNLGKLEGGHLNEAGKWVKPVGYAPPDIRGVLSLQT